MSELERTSVVDGKCPYLECDDHAACSKSIFRNWKTIASGPRLPIMLQQWTSLHALSPTKEDPVSDARPQRIHLALLSAGDPDSAVCPHRIQLASLWKSERSRFSNGFWSCTRHYSSFFSPSFSPCPIHTSVIWFSDNHMQASYCVSFSAVVAFSARV